MKLNGFLRSLWQELPWISVAHPLFLFLSSPKPDCVDLQVVLCQEVLSWRSGDLLSLRLSGPGPWPCSHNGCPAAQLIIQKGIV